MYRKKPPMSVLIVSASEKATEYLRDMLPPAQFSPVDNVGSAGEAKRRILDRPSDIVIINTPLSDEFGTQLALDLADDDSTEVLLFVKNEVYEQTVYTAEEHGVLTLARPSSKQTIYQTLMLLSATRERLRRLEKRAETLEARMQEIRIVTRAKWLLIEHLNMSEAQAHRYIEKTAMDGCIKRSEVAEGIIKTYES